MGAGPEALREFNRDRVAAAVGAGATTRGAVVAATGLARSTVTGLVRDLLSSGVLTELDGAAARPRAVRPDTAAPGRPARALRVASRRATVLAVDFGHSHCRVAVVSLAAASPGPPDGSAGPGDAGGGQPARSARVLAEHTVELDVDADPDGALAQAHRSASALLGETAEDVSAGAIGVPAPVDITTGIVGGGNVLPRWVDRRPAAELSERLGLRLLIDNDANLGALAEAGLGGARGASDLIYVKASTGIGAGLLLGGRIHRGFRGRAGEIGHVPVDPGGSLCRCGNRGCLETIASITELVAATQVRSPQPLTWTDVVDLVRQDDPGAQRLVGDAGRLLGRVLADLVNTLSPERIVLGGDLAATGAPLADAVRESVARYAQPGLARQVEVSLGALGASAQLLGAALLAAGVPAR